MKFTLLYTLLFITILAGIAYAAPDEVFIHGVLRNATTNNLTDTIQNVNLKVYNAAQANVYDTTQNNVHIDDGIYHIVYGALSHTWFLGNYSFIITIGADSYSQTEFVPTPVAHAAYWANDSDLLDGQSGAYYLDDTDTFNTTADIQAVAVGGEVSGTVGAITLDNNALDDQYYELADKVGNSTVEIQAVCYDTPAEIYTAAPHTNRTDADILSLYYAQTDRYTVTNFTVDHTAASHAYVGNCSGANCDIGFGNITSLPDYYTGTQINASCDARDTDTNTWNTTAEIYAAAPHTNRSDTDIRGLFTSSSNISYSSATGLFYFNLSCEAITGSAALWGGDDASAAGDPSVLDIVNQSMFQNETIIRNWNTSWIDLTYFAYTDRFTNTNFTALYFTQTDRYTLTNFTANYYAVNGRYYTANFTVDHTAVTHGYIGNCSGANCDIGFGNITSLPDYYTGLQINASCDARDTDTDTNTWNSTADIYAAAPHTNRTDAEILNLYYTQTDRWTVTNFTSNYFAQTDRYTPTNFSVNLNTALISLDIYNGTQINATQSNYIINKTDITMGTINFTTNLTMNDAGIWHNGSGWCIGGC